MWGPFRENLPREIREGEYAMLFHRIDREAENRYARGRAIN